MLLGTMPAGLETCHGVVAAGATLELPSPASDTILLARQLVGVATIVKRVANYSLQEQQLSQVSDLPLVCCHRQPARPDRLD